MVIHKRKFIILTLLGVFVTFNLYVSGASAQGKDRRRLGPPPEAYSACEGKCAGDTAEFESPHGDMVTGICVKEGNRLVLRPDNPPLIFVPNAGCIESSSDSISSSDADSTHGDQTGENTTGYAM